MISDFWSPELGGNPFLWFKALQFVALCYGCPRKSTVTRSWARIADAGGRQRGKQKGLRGGGGTAFSCVCCSSRRPPPQNGAETRGSAWLLGALALMVPAFPSCVPSTIPGTGARIGGCSGAFTGYAGLILALCPPSPRAVPATWSPVPLLCTAVHELVLLRTACVYLLTKLIAAQREGPVCVFPALPRLTPPDAPGSVHCCACCTQ